MSEQSEKLKELIRDIHGSHHVGDAQHTKLAQIESLIDAHDAQIDVAVSGYKAAVNTAQWQAVTNTELNKLTKQRDELLDALKTIANPRALYSAGDPSVLREFATAAIAKAEA